MKIVSAQILSVRKAGRRYMSVCDAGHRKVSVVHIKRVYNLQKRNEFLVGTNKTVRYIRVTVRRIRRVSVERGCTVLSC